MLISTQTGHISLLNQNRMARIESNEFCSRNYKCCVPMANCLAPIFHATHWPKIIALKRHSNNIEEATNGNYASDIELLARPRTRALDTNSRCYDFITIIIEPRNVMTVANHFFGTHDSHGGHMASPFYCRIFYCFFL